MKTIEGNLIDIDNREFYPCAITITDGRIVSIERNSNSYDCYISPGFIDAHVHVESSMLMPSEFSRVVLSNGTVGVVSDPHEIANVLGVEGIKMMIQNGNQVSLKFFWGIPSCVPATSFDKPGHVITVDDTEKLAKSGQFTMLSEMMNVPGVLNNDPEVMQKIAIAKAYHLRIDGHAPELRGDTLSAYIARGIETDHESTTLEEAEEKIQKGMQILIREGSAAKNYDALKSLIATRTENVMFCTDDSHADDLIEKGHINKIVKRALADGFGLFDIFQIACVNPVKFYHLDVGTLHVGDKADFIVLSDLESLSIQATFIDGEQVYVEGGKTTNSGIAIPRVNAFHHDRIESLSIQTDIEGDTPCIKIIPDNLVTDKKLFHVDHFIEGFQSNSTYDILKIVYVNRYFNTPPRVGFIHGVGLKAGAFASSISHDSHNIIAIGCTDKEITAAINHVIDHKGGLSVVHGEISLILPLPVGGIMSDEAAEQVSTRYLELNRMLRGMGTSLESPFMTLSFMSLMVIPSLKIGEGGLFDVEKLKFI